MDYESFDSTDDEVSSPPERRRVKRSSLDQREARSTNLTDECNLSLQYKAIHGTSDLLRSLSDKMIIWRTIRNETRLRVFVALSVMDMMIAQYVLPNEETEKINWVEFVLYITKPKTMKLKKNFFYIIVAANRHVIYSAIAKIVRIPTCGEPALDLLYFENETYTGIPDTIPDPSSETFPCSEAYSINMDELTERCCVPEDPYNCTMVSIGAWWHKAERCLYFFQMEKSILAVCPEGWTIRALGPLLAKLTNHPETCEMCSYKGSHVDAFNALWVQDEHRGSFAESCACKAPCLWRKASQRDIPINGDHGLCQSLFVASVNSIQIISLHDRPIITGRLDEVIAAGGSGQRVPVNSSAWNLVRLPRPWSATMIAGCSNLSHMITDY